MNQLPEAQEYRHLPMNDDFLEVIPHSSVAILLHWYSNQYDQGASDLDYWQL